MTSYQLFVQDPDTLRYQQLDTYEVDPIKITLSVEDIYNQGSNTSAFSKPLRLPGTFANAKMFKDAFDVNGYNFDASLLFPAYININGSFFISGKINLSAVYKNIEFDYYDYEIVFLGVTSNFSSRITGKTLCDLDFNDYNHNISYSNIVSSWNADGGSVSGLFGGDILYPLIEWGYTYDNSPAPTIPTLSVGGSKSFLSSANALRLDQFKPALRAKIIWDKIFEDAGYTYESDFLNSVDFTNLYIAGDSTDKAFALADNSFSLNTEVIRMFNPNEVINPATDDITSDPNRNLVTSGTSHYYAVPTTGTYTFNITTDGAPLVRSVSPVGGTLSVGLYNQSGVLITSTNIVIPPTGDTTMGFCRLKDPNFTPGATAPFSVPINWTTSSMGMTAGDRVYLRVIPIANGNIKCSYFSGSGPFAGVTDVPTTVSSMKFSCVEYGGSQINPSSILACDKQQIDYIKSIVDRFKLVFVPSTEEKKFSIEPWKDWISSGTTKDWSDKLDKSKDFKISPLFKTQKREQIFIDLEDSDMINYSFQQNFKYPFGRLRLDSNIETIDGIVERKSIFSPTPLAPLGGATASVQWLIPHLGKLTDNPGTLTAKVEPVQPNLRLLYYNGLQYTGLTGATGATTWYMQGTGASGFTPKTQYPLVSSFSNWPVTSTTVDLDWNNPAPVYSTNLTNGWGKINTNTPNTAFTVYWQNWYDLYFDRYGKISEAYFKLTSQDIQNFQFNDRIWVKDAWWLITKIYDYVVGEDTVCKVQMIKSNNINVPLNVNIPCNCQSYRINNPTASIVYYNYSDCGSLDIIQTSIGPGATSSSFCACTSPSIGATGAFAIGGTLSCSYAFSTCGPFAICEDACACGTYSTTIYGRISTIESNTTLYSNADCTTLAADGWYSYAGSFVKGLIYVSNGVPTFTNCWYCGLTPI